MKLYPFDDLPVVITQLRSYDKIEAQKMEEKIRNILENYLDHKIVQKIEIKSIIARDKKFEASNIVFHAYGIPELLRLSFDIMGRSISSATFKKISEKIENLCKDFLDKKIKFVENLFKNEMEILEVSKSLIDDILNNNNNEKKELSENNIFRGIDCQNYFVNYFVESLSNKFMEIYNNLEGEDENMLLDEIKIENEGENKNIIKNEENNAEENKMLENNNEENDINENIQQENAQNENNQQDQEKNEEENINQENERQEEKEMKNKPEVANFIEEIMEKLKTTLDEASKKTFEKIFEERYNIYFKELVEEQDRKNRDFKDNTKIIDSPKVKEDFKKKIIYLL